VGRLKAERKDLASKPQDVPEFYKDKQWKRNIRDFMLTGENE